MPLFNLTVSRTITYLERKRWIAINIEIKVSLRQSDIKPINNPITVRQSCSPRSVVMTFHQVKSSQVSDSWADLEINKQSVIRYLLFSIQLGLQYRASRLRVADISAIPPETNGQTPLITKMMIFCSELEFSHEAQLSEVETGNSSSPDCLVQNCSTCSHFTKI